ncbi:MAG: UDP binding domain-containing protein, partial [Neobacillus sp.]
HVGYDFELLKVVHKINENQREQLIVKLKKTLWNLESKTVGILGLSFKPDTDDMRGAPSVEIIRQLKQEGAMVKAYDPQSMENAKTIIPDIEYCRNPYQVAEGSDAVLIITEWDEFRHMDLNRLKSLLRQPIVIDGRNIFQPKQMEKLGFKYQGVGR